MKNKSESGDFAAQTQISFQAFGVKIGIRSNGEFDLAKINSRLDGIFPNGYQKIKKSEVEHLYSIVRKKAGKFGLYKNEEEIFINTTEENLIEYMGSHLRSTVAEFAIGKVFIHAGVVGWNGKAIVIPGSSFAGKTTLVVELVKRGAVYYSDEYAVLDEDGLVYPYAKKLSIRGIIDDFQQLDFAVEELNGKRGIVPLPVGAVLLAEYEKGSCAKIKVQSRGHGLMEILGHSFALRQNPEFVLSVLSEMVKYAIILKIKRGEVVEFVDFFLEYIDKKKII
jgi:hypothetical protein